MGRKKRDDRDARDPFFLSFFHLGDPQGSEYILGDKTTALLCNGVFGKLTSPQRRRAQNRASQRAYRDRKDRRVKELETELAALAASHEKLERDHSNLCKSHAALVAAEKALVREKRERLKEERVESSSSPVEEGWTCEGQVSCGKTPSSVEMSPTGNFSVRVVLCKRCYGDDAQVSNLSCGKGGGSCQT